MWSVILILGGGAVKKRPIASCAHAAARPSNSPEPEPEGAAACGPPAGQGHDRGRFQRPPPRHSRESPRGQGTLRTLGRRRSLSREVAPSRTHGDGRVSHQCRVTPLHDVQACQPLPPPKRGLSFFAMRRAYRMQRSATYRGQSAAVTAFSVQALARLFLVAGMSIMSREGCLFLYECLVLYVNEI